MPDGAGATARLGILRSDRVSGVALRGILDPRSWSWPLGERFGGCGPEARAPIAAGQLETGDLPGQPDTGDSPGGLDTGDSPGQLDTGDSPGQLDTGDSPGQLDTGDSPGQLETDERNARARAAAES